MEGFAYKGHAGNWIRGFARYIGYTTSIVEFWALRVVCN